MIGIRTALAALMTIAVFAPAHAATERVLHRFRGGKDGAFPISDLLRVQSTLYGVTEFGGGGPCAEFGFKGCGTVYSLTKKRAQPAVETVVYAFQGGVDGAYPYAGVTKVGDAFYGTTYAGGAYGNGTVFSLTPQGAEHVLYSFMGGDDGANPRGGLIDVGGTLYGTTTGGGVAVRGTFFSITTAGVEQVLHSFGEGSDGVAPEADLINVGGTLYGITFEGGSSNWGTVYAITTAGQEHVLHSFAFGLDGCCTQAQERLLNIGGTLYGTAFEGGAKQGAGYGVVYSVTTTGSENVIHAFTGANGDAFPLSGLTSFGTSYYGTTESGGFGTVYSITTDGVESVIYNFKGGSDGYAPYAGLTKVRSTLYGTTAGGGGKGHVKGCLELRGCGTVFAIKP